MDTLQPSLIHHFNPRSHEGSDTNLSISIAYFSISIHAPTRGATESLHSHISPVDYFNPRSHEGSDACYIHIDSSSIKFQSTLPRGERHMDTLQPSLIHHFNPRSHEGSDVATASVIYIRVRFQSTLPRGERHTLFI